MEVFSELNEGNNATILVNFVRNFPGIIFFIRQYLEIVVIIVSDLVLQC